MEIQLNDLTCIITFNNKNEEKIIKHFCTYKDNSAAFFGGRFHPERVKNICMGKEVKGYFVVFAGLAKEIIVEAKNNNISITKFTDNRTHFDFQKKEWTHDELRELFNLNYKYVEHQIRALQVMLKTNNGIIKACTSAGKTSIFKAFMKLTDLPTLILVDKVSLGQQIYNEIKEYGLDCGFCSGKGVIEGKNMVSTIQSVKKVPNLTSYKCLIIDECHLSSSNTFQDFLTQFGCPLKFGFSASPSNGDYLSYAKIRQFLGSVNIEIKSEELIENNVMAKPTIYFIKNEAKEGCFDYLTSYNANIVNNEIRNNIIVNIANLYDRGVAILVTSVEQGKNLENIIPNSKFIYGETTLSDRQKYIKDFNDGTLKVLIGSNILNTGISITNMFVLIQAAGQKAQTTSIQRIGRVLRIGPNKQTAKYYDFLDIGDKFLEKHSKRRLLLLKKEGYEDIHILDNDLNEIPLDKKK